MAWELATTLSDFCAQVHDAGANHAAGLVHWQAELQNAAERTSGERQTECLTLLEALQTFILTDDDPEGAFVLLRDLLDGICNSLREGEGRAATETTAIEAPLEAEKLSNLLNDFADQVEAVGFSFAPGLAPWQQTWQQEIDEGPQETRSFCSELLSTLQAFILADEDHENFFGKVIDAICDLRQYLDGVASEHTSGSEAEHTAAPPANQSPSAGPPSAEHLPEKLPLSDKPPSGPQQLVADVVPSPALAKSRAVDECVVDLAAPELMLEFTVEGTEQLSECSDHLLLLEKSPNDKESLGAIFRCFHTIKGVAGFMGMDQLQGIAHAAEDLLDQARSGKLALVGRPLEAIFDASDILGSLINQIPGSLEKKPWKAPESVKAPDLVARIRNILDSDSDAGGPVSHELPLARIDPSTPSEAGTPTSTKPSRLRSGPSQHDSIRVDAERLDHLVDMIGELVINESMLIRALEIGDERETQRQLVRMGKVTREVQSVGGSLRMVPVRSCFSKMARLARDVAKKSQKKVNFTLVGEDTELDKTVVDRIADPLVHLVRNAIDHGLESSADERLEAGKPGVGEVQLSAFHRGGNIHIEIEDDGRGLNRDRIVEVAIERGLLSEGDNPSDREVFRLICEAGFSTKKQVTSLSGRGVGMDVVKRQIDRMGGTLEIQSTRGKGSCFSMRVPLTLAVIDGMVIGLGQARFVIPTLNIVRLVEPDEAHISTIFEHGEMLVVAGEPIPILRMENLFNLVASTAERRLAVVAEADGMRVALLIDELLGQQQAVIKNLGQGLGDVAGVSGCAIMPDGRVGLVLDIAGLLDLASKSTDATETTNMNPQQLDAAATEEQWMS